MIIAIVEDEPKLAAILQEYLQNDGFSTRLYSDGNVALAQLRSEPPDLILLDLMLPGLDGMSICKELRKTSNVPIIMLTARVEEIDRLLGLEVGADDYICKPFSPREVVARVKAVLRRSNDHNNSTTTSFITTSASIGPGSASGITSGSAAENSTQNPDNFQVNETSATVSVNGHVGPLTAVEIRLLITLCERPGQIFGRSQLMRRMYEDNRIVSDRTIDSHVKKLRQKIEALDNARQYIHSVYGIGYKFELLDV